MTSTIVLAIDNPLYDQNSKVVKFLGIIDISMTVIFTIECMINIVLLGFLFNGRPSYLRDGWNQLDFIIVVFSIVSLAAKDSSSGFFKIFRMLRVLRPLRVLKRNPGLRIQVMSLLNAVPGIRNLMIITTLLLLLFGILGVNLFKGTFNYCYTDNMPHSAAG